MTDVQQLVSDLQKAIGIEVDGGQLQLILNINDGRFETWDMKLHGRAPKKSIDNRPTLRAQLTR